MDRNEKTNTSPTIGIGLTTTPSRQNLYKIWMEQFEKYKPSKYHLHVHNDELYKGVAYSKNQNLKSLQGCDYIFLFDDDCTLIDEGFFEFIINSKLKHLLFLNDKLHNKYETELEAVHEQIKGFKTDGITNVIKYYKDCGGVFMFLTKEVLNEIGAFNEEFEGYGFEHVEYSDRILGMRNAYPCLKGTEQYLKALDYEQDYTPSSIPYHLKQHYIKQNWDKYFNQPIKNRYIPL